MGKKAIIGVIVGSVFLAASLGQDTRPAGNRAAAEEAVSSPPPADFFVSPQGDDRWSGKGPNPGANDGPFATVTRAQEAVRALRQAQAEPRPVRVVLRGGTYYLPQTLEFGPEDSGTEDAPITYAAAPGEKVVLSGGRRLDGGSWGEVNGHRAWVVELPEGQKGQWRFRQLFVNGERRPRTRLPREGEYQIQSLPDLDKETSVFDQYPRRFAYAGNDIRRWHNLSDVEVVAPCRWREGRLAIQDVDEAHRIVAFHHPSVSELVEGDSRLATYWVENVFEALDTPGQWYLDRPRGRLYYLPAPGEDAPPEVVAPRLAQVLRLVGGPGSPVRRLQFEGITWAHSEWQPPEGWPGSRQAAEGVPGAVYLAYAERCRFCHCAVEHVGSYAIEVGQGCTDVEIRRCRLTDLGAGGLVVGHGSVRTTVADNEIAHGGRIFLGAVGVWIGHRADNRVVHNHLQDLYYSGISVGWQWDFSPSKSARNIIEHNHIQDLGHGMLSDIGGVYTLGLSPGTRLRYNVIHDIRHRNYGGWGIYTDQGSGDLLVERNLAYRCSSGPLFVSDNRNITVQNNILAFGQECQIHYAYGQEAFQYAFRRNLVYHDQGRVVGYWDPESRQFT